MAAPVRGSSTGKLSSARATAYEPPNLPDIKVLAVTWNVGNARPAEAELQHWLPEGGGDNDLVVVGTQENAFKDKKKGAAAASGPIDVGNVGVEVDSDDDDAPAEKSVAPASPSPAPEGGAKVGKGLTVWDTMVADRLGAGYRPVKHLVLWEMRLTVYAKAEHLKGLRARISKVESSSSATGIAGVLGNKGGLVIKLDFGRTSLAFVSCHLAAHSHKLKERNLNCQEVLRETAKSMGDRHLDAVSQFDHVFWLGDLNYRTDLLAAGQLPAESDEAAHHAEVLKLIEAKEWGKLLDADQLRACRAKGEAFVGFVEGDSNFKPTFKVKRVAGTEHKDQRIPSYCDRVLWKSMPPLVAAVKQESLRGVETVSTSDHKPVVATFSITPSECLSVPHARDAPPTPRHNLPRRGSIAAALGGKQPQPVVRITDLELTGLVDADVGGGSDPYCVFLTNPPNILGPSAPITTTKRRAARARLATMGEASAPKITEGRVEDAAASGQAAKPGDQADAPAPDLEEAAGPPTAWEDPEVPLLRPHVYEGGDLRHTTLIVCVVDHDNLSQDDQMGCALVPLAPPAGSEGAAEYVIKVAQPLTMGNTSRGYGQIRCTLTVSYGESLETALTSASASKAGTLTKTIASKQKCCTVQ